MDSERTMLSPRLNLVRKVESWIEGHPHQPIHIDDLCVALKIRPRTLQRVFHETVGMGPAHYLAAKRLEQARATLLTANPDKTSVTQIAFTHGFRELGRFAGTYRRTFGEKPSETLHKRQRMVLVTNKSMQRLGKLPGLSKRVHRHSGMASQV